jgi:exopolyphosphatase/guanosine-5'-triphosphate,3'-diphosphate pyrophosphatase
MDKSADLTHPFESARYYGAIDLGSQNCRLIIAERQNGKLASVETFSRFVCLGEGVARTQKLSKRAMERALPVLTTCAKKLHSYPNTVYFAVATAAARNAVNALHFIKRVEREIGISLHIITSQQEALFAALGSLPLIHPSTKQALIFDIGGGSTELMLLNLDIPDTPQLVDAISMPYGVVSLAEVMQQASLTATSFRAYAQTVAEIQALAENFAIKNNLLSPDLKTVQLVGTSGTTTTVAALHYNLRFYDRTKIEGTQLSFDNLKSVIHFVHSMQLEERLRHPCIGQAKNDLILGGLAIFEGIFSVWPSLPLTVTDRGVRDGIVYALANYETYESCFNGQTPYHTAP